MRSAGNGAVKNDSTASPLIAPHNSRAGRAPRGVCTVFTSVDPEAASQRRFYGPDDLSHRRIRVVAASEAPLAASGGDARARSVVSRVVRGFFAQLCGRVKEDGFAVLHEQLLVLVRAFCNHEHAARGNLEGARGRLLGNPFRHESKRDMSRSQCMHIVESPQSSAAHVRSRPPYTPRPRRTPYGEVAIGKRYRVDHASGMLRVMSD